VLTIAYAQMQQSTALRAYGNWAVDKLNSYTNQVKSEYILYADDMVRRTEALNDRIKGGEGVTVGGGNVNVPSPQVWSKSMVYSTTSNRPRPVATFDHPTFKDRWGIFLQFEGHALVFTIRKYARSVIGSIIHWITNLIAKIIDFVSDVFDWLRDLGCTLSRSYLDTLSRVAANKIPLTTDVSAKLQTAGLSAVNIASLKMSITLPAVRALADKITDTVCPSPPAVTKFPAGTIATRKGTAWRVAVPVPVLSGKGDYTVTETEKDPTAVGAKEVPEWLFQYRIGERSWYETPPAWAGFGLAMVGTVGGAYYIKKRRG
jgi:hypothetical protein